MFGRSGTLLPKGTGIGASWYDCVRRLAAEGRSAALMFCQGTGVSQ